MANVLGSIGGLFNRAANVSHVVHVVTGDRHGAGTDANVWIIYRDKDGNESDAQNLDHWLLNDHERGKTSSFRIHGKHHVGAVSEIELWRDDWGVGSAWFVDRVEVEHVHLEGKRHVFPIQRWIKPDVRYSIEVFDSCLPQNSHNPEQRKNELDEKRKMYEYTVNVPGGPAQIKNLPADEMFSGEYMWEMLSIKYVTTFMSKIIGWTLSDWKSVDDVKKLYKFAWAALRPEEPYTMNQWEDDKWFGQQRVQGCNPVLIKLCTEIPEKFGVTEELANPFLEGLTLSQALKSKRIFIVDLEILHGLPSRGDRVLCAPLALFYLNKERELTPVAIQLFQNKGPENPVFTPKDYYYTWLLVKMYYNNADATFHQAYTHLGFTHLIMEGVVVCTHRNLSPSHPLYRLLAPHFLYLLAINTRGLDKLVSEGGWVDRTMTCGRLGMFELIRKGLKVWRLDLNGYVPKEIESRGVMSADVLPYYPYRDDAVAIFKAIREYVAEIVNHYYESNDDIAKDSELKSWRDELVLSREGGGVGLLGVLGDDRSGFRTIDEIIDTVSSIISVCSIGHAAANFQQYDEYAFPPNYPASLYGEVPNSMREITETEVVDHLPKKDITLDIMVITKLLSNKGTKSLGDFEVQYMYDPIAIEAARKFRNDLERVSESIKERHANSKTVSYVWLDPKDVPNAISI